MVESSVAKVNGILFMDLILALYVRAIDVANTWKVRVAEMSPRAFSVPVVSNAT